MSTIDLIILGSLCPNAKSAYDLQKKLKQGIYQDGLNSKTDDKVFNSRDQKSPCLGRQY